MNLNSARLDLVFLVPAMIFTIVSPLAGWMGDKTVCQSHYIVKLVTKIASQSVSQSVSPSVTQPFSQSVRQPVS